MIFRLHGVAGLAAYTLHDKPVVVDGETEYPVTSERVAWRAGVSARGRKLAAPYGHMSLNWGPTEQPTREEMVGALEVLSKIGITKNDTEHPHVHVVFRRGAPETGKVANRRRAPNRARPGRDSSPR